jgi:hypothetical protein
MTVFLSGVHVSSHHQHHHTKRESGTTLDLTFGFNCLVQAFKNYPSFSNSRQNKNSQFGKDPKEETIKTIPILSVNEFEHNSSKKLKSPEVSRFISSFGEFSQTKLWNSSVRIELELESSSEPCPNIL